MMIMTVTSRVVASVVIRWIWWLLPSTRTTQVCSWSGSRRWASAKIRAITVAEFSATLAISHLFLATGTGVGSAVSSGVARMSVAVGVSS